MSFMVAMVSDGSKVGVQMRSYLMIVVLQSSPYYGTAR
jgi:hypothetical protein